MTHTDWVDDYTLPVGTDPNQPNKYLVPSSLARGGEIITETACDPTDAACHFPAYPGTVIWKVGLQFLRDAPVGDDGQELTGDDLSTWITGTTQRRRFDPKRQGLFHYILNAHAMGRPKSLPCLYKRPPSGAL